jgi:PAS domain-containing protein
MEWDTRQKNVVLILARDMAEKLATPMFVVDAEGTLVFYNEAAETLLGKTFADAGEMKAEEWMAEWAPIGENGQPMKLRDLALGRALFEGHPDHHDLAIRASDGVKRTIAATAIPLQTHPDEIVGAVALFWVPSQREEDRP